MDEVRLVAEPRAAAFELAGTGLVVVDDAGIILRANLAFANLIGARRMDLPGSDFLGMFAPRSRELARRALKGALVADALPMPATWILQRRDGGELRVLLHITATEMPSGRLGAVLTIIDISVLTRTETRLVAVLEEQRLILDNAQVGIVFTRGLRILRYNAAFLHLCEGEEAALSERPLSAIFEAGSAPPRLGPSSRFQGECRLRRATGEELWCMVDGHSFGMQDGEPQIIWTLRDITQERAAHAALEAVRADLEERVIARTQDLADKNVELEKQIAERREIEERLRAKNEQLLFNRNQLLELAERNEADFAAALRHIAEVGLRTLEVDRLSFWRLHVERNLFLCEFALRADGSPEPPDAPRELRAAEQIAGFASLKGHRIVSTSDIEPGSAELRAQYLRPLGIVSMLEMPVWLEGRIIGKVGFESMQPGYEWLPEDLDFAAGLCTLIALAQEAEQRQLAEAKLRRLAHFDALTGLPNRHLLLDRLKQALAFAQRHRSRVGLMFIDLDRFKTINDSLGHLVGDKLLVEVARRLTASLRTEDSVARIGGDEFVVVLQDLRNIQDAATVAQNLLNAIEPPYRIDGRDLHVSGSVGIAVYPEDGRDIETLMRNADTAMYHVKDAGRNAFKFFTAAMNEQASARLAMENDLRRAMKSDELVLHFQPQFDLRSGRMRAIEALLRWQHPQQGMIQPDAFIPIAEESGLIQNIGEWTLVQACRQLKAWQDTAVGGIPMAVNLSARQFRNPHFSMLLETLLREHRTPATSLELEITESGLMPDAESTLETMCRLKVMGLRLAIDDFGTGYSSLAYLKRFPIDKLKIDRSFIRDIPGDSDDMAISSAIISMSKDLALRVVAEGVESRAQMEFLRGRGCDDAQGFFLCPPLPAEQLEARVGGDPIALPRN
jgi:diguanylate cyclase (GGDEF)-like protein/PAS domain S-box-containing protein